MHFLDGKVIDDLNVIDSRGSKKRDVVMIEVGSKRIDVINIEAEEEEESTTRKSKARKQSGGNNGKQCNSCLLLI